MSCYYQTKRDMLILKCDVCGKQVDLFRHETDRTLKHDYIHENGWKTMKDHEAWIDICSDCKQALEDVKRQKWIASAGGSV